MIKVMHILSDSNIGGAGRYVADVTSALDPELFESDVAVPGGARITPLIGRGVTVLEVPDMAPDQSFSWPSLLALFLLIRRHRPDIVHTHASLAGRIAARLNGVKLVYTRHTAGRSHEPGSLRWRLGSWMNRILADRAIAVSDYMAELMECEGLPRGMIKRIYNGVDPARFCNAEYDPGQLKQEQGLDGRIVCSVLGRLEPVKGHQGLLEAWEKVYRSEPLAMLLVIGEGSQREELESRVKAAGLGEAVSFAGLKTDVKPYLAMSDVLVMPSIDESFGIALIEAMSMSVACVATGVGGMLEIIRDGQDGILVPPQDSDALAEALIRLMASPELRQKLGVSARQSVEERFSVQRLAGELGDLYLELMKKERQGAF